MSPTRPEIPATFGVVTKRHRFASAVGMSMLKRGRNAFDAVAVGLTLQIVEPNLVAAATPRLMQAYAIGR